MTHEESKFVQTLKSAGNIAPDDKVYEVVVPHGHKTLQAGDRVVMREVAVAHIGRLMFLLRVSDYTLHDLRDDSQQYVLCVEVANSVSLDYMTRELRNARLTALAVLTDAHQPCAFTDCGRCFLVRDLRKVLGHIPDAEMKAICDLTTHQT